MRILKPKHRRMKPGKASLDDLEKTCRKQRNQNPYYWDEKFLLKVAMAECRRAIERGDLEI